MPGVNSEHELFVVHHIQRQHKAKYEMNFTQLLEAFDSGKLLSPEESVQLESALKSDSSDIVSRMKLLGYYRGHPHSPRYAVHLAWFIDHQAHEEEIVHFAAYVYLRGTNESVYNQLKVHWLKHVEADQSNPAAIFNAADFFILNKDFELAFTCVQKLESCSLKASDFFSMAALYEHLGNLVRKDNRETFSTELFQKAIAWYEKATVSDDQNWSASTNLVKLLFEVNRFDQLKDTAAQVLKNADENIVPAAWSIHQVNVTLGKVALAEGDSQSAVRHLAASVEIPHDPSLLSLSGPDMTLARALLEKGEKQAVLDFLAECEQFSLRNHAEDLLQEWKEAIAEGRTPK